MSDEKSIPQAPISAPAPTPPLDRSAARAAVERWGIWSGPRPGEPNRPPYSLKAMD